LVEARACTSRSVAIELADWIRQMLTAARLSARSQPPKSQLALPTLHGRDGTLDLARCSHLR
jgi:hypothetical protein